MIRVAIVADTRLYREGLAQVLGRDAGLCVVATAARGDEALAASGSPRSRRRWGVAKTPYRAVKTP